MLSKFNYHYESFEDVDIFLLKINDNSDCIDFDIIPSEQVLDIKKYRLANDRAKKLIARSFLYHYLKFKFKINNFTLGYSKYQKPLLNENVNVDFSISYSGEYVLVAVSNSKVGIDIEYIDKNINHDQLKDVVMHPKEIIYYNELLTESQRLDFFFSVFNFKEAIIKALGVGLYVDVTKINILDLSVFTYAKINNSNITVATKKILLNYKVSVSKAY